MIRSRKEYNIYIFFYKIKKRYSQIVRNRVIYYIRYKHIGIVGIKGENNMKIAKSLVQLIGNTPLLELSNYNKEKETLGTIIGKLEYFNPGGSVKG